MHSNRIALASSCAAWLVGVASAQPVLPDWTQAAFTQDSAAITNPLFPLPEGLLSIYEGDVDGVLEHIRHLSTFNTRNILGVENRVIRDATFHDGLLAEVAFDWYAQDTDGNVWYFGEDVTNYHYDDDGNLIGTDKDGSWIADGVTNQPGVMMWSDPQVGDEYYQEWAPGVAFDFATVEATDAVVDIPFGHYIEALHTAEGNLFDGPGITDFKFYAPGVGLVLSQPLDDNGNAEFNIPLIDQRMVPTPAGASLLLLGAAGLIRRRRA